MLIYMYVCVAPRIVGVWSMAVLLWELFECYFRQLTFKESLIEGLMEALRNIRFRAKDMGSPKGHGIVTAGTSIMH